MLTKLQSRKKQIEAESLYMQGMAKDAIAKEIHVADLTLDRWEKALSWKDRRKLVDEEISRKISASVVETKERHIKISRAIQAIFAQQINDKKVAVGDVIRSMQHEKDWIEPSNYNPIINLKNNTQINVDANIHQLVELVEKAQNKTWKSKNPLPL